MFLLHTCRRNIRRRRSGHTALLDRTAGRRAGSASSLRGIVTGGRMTDVAIEAVGNQPAFTLALRLTRPGGTMSAVGNHGISDASLELPLDRQGPSAAPARTRRRREARPQLVRHAHVPARRD